MLRNDDVRSGYETTKMLPMLYPFPIDFLDEERLTVVLGALCREAEITESQAKVVAALLAGYGSDRLIGDRIGITRTRVRNTLTLLRKRFGFTSRAHLARGFWPIYDGLRGHALLLPRVEPYQLPEEAVYVRNEQTPDRGFPQQMAFQDRQARMGRSQQPPPQSQELALASRASAEGDGECPRQPGLGG